MFKYTWNLYQDKPIFGVMKQTSVNVKDSNHTSMFSNQSGIKLEISDEKCLKKIPNYLKTK